VAGGPDGAGGADEVAELEALPPAQRANVGDAWGVMTAVSLMKVGLHLQKELMEEKIFHFITEWSGASSFGPSWLSLAISLVSARCALDVVAIRTGDQGVLRCGPHVATL
jgi:hypothetical protein